MEIEFTKYYNNNNNNNIFNLYNIIYSILDKFSINSILGEIYSSSIA